MQHLCLRHASTSCLCQQRVARIRSSMSTMTLRPPAHRPAVRHGQSRSPHLLPLTWLGVRVCRCLADKHTSTGPTGHSASTPASGGAGAEEAERFSPAPESLPTLTPEASAPEPLHVTPAPFVTPALDAEPAASDVKEPEAVAVLIEPIAAQAEADSEGHIIASSPAALSPSLSTAAQAAAPPAGPTAEEMVTASITPVAPTVEIAAEQDKTGADEAAAGKAGADEAAAGKAGAEEAAAGKAGAEEAAAGKAGAEKAGAEKAEAGAEDAEAGVDKPGATVQSHPINVDEYFAAGELVTELQSGVGSRKEGWFIAQLGVVILIATQPFKLQGFLDVAGVVLLTAGLVFLMMMMPLQLLLLPSPLLLLPPPLLPPPLLLLLLPPPLLPPPLLLPLLLLPPPPLLPPPLLLPHRVYSLLSLGRNLSPMPVPRARHTLVTSGMYAFVRHPMYAGLLMFCMGLTILTRSETRILLVLLLWWILEQKSVVEEVALLERYPDEYAEYKARVKKGRGSLAQRGPSPTAPTKLRILRAIVAPAVAGGPSPAPAPSSSSPAEAANPLPAVSPAASDETKSDEYSETMNRKMGTSLSYRHELGIDYNRILPDLIVGSCLQARSQLPPTAEDVDRLAEQEGVTTIFSLQAATKAKCKVHCRHACQPSTACPHPGGIPLPQEDCDMAYFKLDLEPIKARCMERGDVKHVRFPIRDFDPYDLRRKLPKAVARLAREHDPKVGTVYIHCTAGMGRAPATALAYMNWIRGMQLDHAYSMLTSMRRCGPKASVTSCGTRLLFINLLGLPPQIEAIRSATSDLLLGTDPVETTIAVHRFGQAKSIQVAGLDVGWHAPLPMEKETKPPFRFVLHRKLYPGKYQYKLIVDGNWTFSADHPTARDNNNTSECLLALQQPEAACDPAACTRSLCVPCCWPADNVLEVIPAKMDPMTVQTQMRLLTPNTQLTQAEQEELRAMLCPWAMHNNPGDWGPTEPATLVTPAREDHFAVITDRLDFAPNNLDAVFLRIHAAGVRLADFLQRQKFLVVPRVHHRHCSMTSQQRLTYIVDLHD
ncbi:hypothetical protein QJQ45_021950 [Haematococcus lacustris]|nr:hypothetical protein QJQ45_021950 [Haematococcus lacustris]